jgi:hypothetical protein
MIQVAVENSVKNILSQLTELAELRDATGQIIGYFAPISLRQAAAYAAGAAHFDPAEIKRLKEQADPGRTTQEVLQRLEALERAK